MCVPDMLLPNPNSLNWYLFIGLQSIKLSSQHNSSPGCYQASPHRAALAHFKGLIFVNVFPKICIFNLTKIGTLSACLVFCLRASSLNRYLLLVNFIYIFFVVALLINLIHFLYGFKYLTDFFLG